MHYKNYEWARLAKPSKRMRMAVGITRLLLTPIFVLVRFYCWVWDYDYWDKFKRH